MDIETRWATDDDLPAIALADGRAFGEQYTAEDMEDRRIVLDLSRFLLAVDDGEIVGITGDFQLQMTMPGGACLPFPGVTWVSVAATHRRRGVLTRMMREQHQRFLDEGAALSALTASEGRIYGRFGYGPATLMRKTVVDRRAARLRADLPESGRVRFVAPEEARRILPGLHQRWCATTPGAVARDDRSWDFYFLDREKWRDGASECHYVVHPDGFVAYRVASHWNERAPAHEIRVRDLFAAAPGADVDLWRFLLGLDLAGPINCWDVAADDPLPFLLDDVRAARTTVADDGVWIRPLDIAATLGARRYRVDGRLTLDVHDGFLDRGGRFTLEGGPGGATVSAAAGGTSADLSLGVGALGSIFLGAHSASTLARAGLIDEHTPGALDRADLMFSVDRQPRHGTGF